VLNLKPAPEFEKWLIKQGIVDNDGNMLPANQSHGLLDAMIK
jgi:ethanolamine ammonia-lyase large subunit